METSDETCGEVSKWREEMPTESEDCLRVLFFRFVVVIILGQLIFIVVGFFLVLIIVIGDSVDFYGMDLDHFHLGFAFHTGEDLAFFYFVFIHVDFSGAFRTPDHGETLLADRTI
jgi:hypothetical protein